MASPPIPFRGTMRACGNAATVVLMRPVANRLPITISRPPRADVVLAAVIGIAGLVEIVLTTVQALRLVPVVLLTVAPLPWRREQPFAVLLVCLAVVAVGETVGYPGQGRICCSS